MSNEANKDLPVKTIKKPAKKYTELNKTQQKVYDFTLSNTKGIEQAKLLGVTPQHISRVKKDLSRYFIAYDKKLLKKSKKVAHKIMDDFMDGDVNIKASDTISIMKMQQDRIDPVKTISESTSVEIKAIFTNTELDSIK